MNPIRSIVEIRFSEPSRRYDFVGGVARALGSPAPQVALGQNIKLKIKDRKISILVEAARFWINIEEELKPKEFESITLDYILKLQQNLQWGKFSRIGCRMMWIKQANDFEGLVQKTKEKLLQHNSIVASAMDVGLPLTLTDGDKKINFIYGPMKKEELALQGFEFDIVAPDVFAFVDIDYFSTDEHSLHPKYFKTFLDLAYRFSVKTVEDLLSILGV